MSEAHSDELSTCGFMPHNDGYPNLSRDWQDIDCGASVCERNRSGKCQVPSLAIISKDGRCEGFKPKGLLKIKEEGEIER